MGKSLTPLSLELDVPKTTIKEKRYYCQNYFSQGNLYALSELIQFQFRESGSDSDDFMNFGWGKFCVKIKWHTKIRQLHPQIEIVGLTISEAAMQLSFCVMEMVQTDLISVQIRSFPLNI